MFFSPFFLPKSLYKILSQFIFAMSQITVNHCIKPPPSYMMLFLARFVTALFPTSSEVISKAHKKEEKGEHLPSPFTDAKHTRRPSAPEIHDLHFTSFQCSPLLACFSQLRWIIELQWGAGTKSAYCDVTLRHPVNELKRETRALWVFWSLRLTPLRFLMDHAICNLSRTYVPVHEGGEGGKGRGG